MVQTPQTFLSDILLDSYDQEFSEDFTDDASVLEAKGHKIVLFDGNNENIKITTKVDLLIAEAYTSKNN